MFVKIEIESIYEKIQECKSRIKAKEREFNSFDFKEEMYNLMLSDQVIYLFLPKKLNLNLNKTNFQGRTYFTPVKFIHQTNRRDL